MSDGEWRIQVSWKGLDSAGREVMINIRGNTAEEFNALQKAYTASINGLKPIPVRTWVGGKGKEQKKLLPPSGGPKCPNHPDELLTIAEWKNSEGRLLYFWECNVGGRGCKDAIRGAIKSYPSPSQVADWRKVNELEAPAPVANGQQTQNATAQAAHPTPNLPAAYNATVFWEKARKMNLPQGTARDIINEAGGEWETAYKLLLKLEQAAA